MTLACPNCGQSAMELIDTLWNVNGIDPFLVIIIASELIDTLWNVNTFVLHVYLTLIGINRYIMECKYLSETIRIIMLTELIDTLWNVNPPPGKKLKHVCQN